MSQEESKSPLTFFLIGGALVVLLKLFVFDSRTPFQDRIYDALHKEEVIPAINNNADNLGALLRRDRREGEEPYDLFEEIRNDFLALDIIAPEQKSATFLQEDELIMQGEEKVPPSVSPYLPDQKLPQENADLPSTPQIELPPKKGYAPLSFGDPALRVVIIIDDVGVNRKYSLEAIGMDSRLSLAFLPYAKNLKEMTQEAQEKGHELMVHVPMEAMDQTLDLGPNGLRTGSSEADFKKTLHDMFESFEGYIGINNHMGSRLTQDAQRMSWVMEALKARGLFFLDSKTIHTSIAADAAQSYGIPFATRHVFLDHEESLEAVRRQLKRLEDSAYKRGYAIAIGHPKKNTLQAIAEWLPDIEGKGIKLVPISRLIAYPKGMERVATVVVPSFPPVAVVSEVKAVPEGENPESKKKAAPPPVPKPSVPKTSFTLDLLKFGVGDLP